MAALIELQQWLLCEIVRGDFTGGQRATNALDDMPRLRHRGIQTYLDKGPRSEREHLGTYISISLIAPSSVDQCHDRTRNISLGEALAAMPRDVNEASELPPCFAAAVAEEASEERPEQLGKRRFEVPSAQL